MRRGTPCTWTRVPAAAYYATAEVAVVGRLDRSLYTRPDGIIGRNYADGTTASGWSVSCDGRTDFRWVRDDVDPADVIDAAADSARGSIGLPTPDISPTGLGTVNVGMWLAVTPQTPPPARAELGAVWAEVAPRLVSTTWDFGNGDTVSCDGPGTPITDLDTFEEGPCGYTYRQPSPDGTPYRLSVTTTWALDYRSSAGDGSLAPISRTATVDYPVREIETIGISG